MGLEQGSRLSTDLPGELGVVQCSGIDSGIDKEWIRIQRSIDHLCWICVLICRESSGRVGKPLLVMVDRRFDMGLNMGWDCTPVSHDITVIHNEMLYINGGYTTLGQVSLPIPILGFSSKRGGNMYLRGIERQKEKISQKLCNNPQKNNK